MTTVTVSDGRTSVPGLYYHQNVIPKSAQDELLRFFEGIKEEPASEDSGSPLFWEKAGIASRKVLHFGYQYPYNRALKLIPTHPIPEIIQRLLIEPLQNLPGVKGPDGDWLPDQVIINRYLCKQGIGAHTDHKKLFQDRIVCVTLGEPADMLFKHMELENCTIGTEPGSVYVMTGKARWEYTHEMIPHRFDKPRYSITFRHVDPKYIVGTPHLPLVLSPAANVANPVQPKKILRPPIIVPRSRLVGRPVGQPGILSATSSK